MVMFEVLVNGEVICRAGGKDVWHIFAGVDHRKKKELPNYVVHGMRFSEPNLNEMVYWSNETNLNVGDELTVRVLEGDNPTQSVTRHSFGSGGNEGVEDHYCSFCGKHESEVVMLISRLANICHECLRRYQPKE